MTIHGSPRPRHSVAEENEDAYLMWMGKITIVVPTAQPNQSSSIQNELHNIDGSIDWTSGRYIYYYYYRPVKYSECSINDQRQLFSRCATEIKVEKKLCFCSLCCLTICSLGRYKGTQLFKLCTSGYSDSNQHF